MARKPLGRGLSSLLGEDTTPLQSTVPTELGVEEIVANREQPRTRFGEKDLDELAQSIRANGIVQPIVVRPHGDKYQIVAGERRWRAAQRGLRKIPVTVREVSDEKLLELALVENIQRAELNPIEEAKAYRKLIDSIGLTQEQVSERVGKERTLIATSLRLLKLPADVQDLIQEEKLSAGHGRALLMSSDADVQRRVARNAIEKGMSVRETERSVKRAGETKEGSASKLIRTDADPNVTAAEVKLKRRLSTGVKIVPLGKGRSGRIEIEFYTEGDLDRLYNLIIGK